MNQDVRVVKHGASRRVEAQIGRGHLAASGEKAKICHGRVLTRLITAITIPNASSLF